MSSRALTNVTQLDDLRKEYKKLKNLYIQKKIQSSKFNDFSSKRHDSFNIPSIHMDPSLINRNLDNDEKMSFYNCCPCSFVSIDHDSFRLVFSVWYYGKKTGSYECCIKMDHDTMKLYIHDHNFPSFIPLHLFEYKLLNKNIRKFILCISNCLNAFKSRQSQLEEATNLYQIENVSFNESYDFIQYDITISDHIMYNIVLKYDDLRDCLPTYVYIRRKENSSNRINELEALFKNDTISNAIHSLKSHTLLYIINDK